MAEAYAEQEWERLRGLPPSGTYRGGNETVPYTLEWDRVLATLDAERKRAEEAHASLGEQLDLAASREAANESLRWALNEARPHVLASPHFDADPEIGKLADIIDHELSGEACKERDTLRDRCRVLEGLLSGIMQYGTPLYCDDAQEVLGVGIEGVPVVSRRLVVAWREAAGALDEIDAERKRAEGAEARMAKVNNEFLGSEGYLPEHFMATMKAIWRTKASARQASTLRDEITKLRGLLREARDEIENFGEQVSPYFQEKWDLPGVLKKFDSALAEGGGDA